MDGWESDVSQCISKNAAVAYEELEKNLPSRPLDFPSPIVHRGSRIRVDVYDSKKGEYNRISNLLVRTSYNKGTGSKIDNNKNTVEYDEMKSDTIIGYYIRKKLASTLYGGVYKCVVMKKRKLHFGESTLMLDELQELKTKCSLDTINEDDTIEPEDERFEETNIVSPKCTFDGVWESTGECVAVKISSWSKIRRLRGKHLEDPIKEIQCMQLIGNYHSHFVSHIDALQDDHYLYNVMQYCNDGDLYSVVMSEINTNKRVDEYQARKWFRQILCGLHHLQQKGVCHRDLSLENILVHQNSIKIVDFGLSLRVPFMKSNNINGHGRHITDVSEGDTRLLMTAQGQSSNWAFMSPEVVKKGSDFDGFSHDLWAAGVILYILLVGHKPFHWAHKSDKQFLLLSENRSLKETLLYWGISLSDDAFDLLQNMLLRDPRQRLTLAQVMHHPWVKTTDDGNDYNEIDKTSTDSKENKISKLKLFQSKTLKKKGKHNKKGS